MAAAILYAPGKAANAGGVAVSGLEMSQNSAHLRIGREEVDARLRADHEAIHTAVSKPARRNTAIPQNYVLVRTSPASSRWPTR